MVCSEKLDKIDKIFISLIFIIVTFLCIFNTFSYASEIIEPIEKGTGLFISNDGTIIEDSTGYYLVYNITERGIYTLTTTRDIIYGYSNNNIELGDKLSYKNNLRPNNSITIEINEPNTVIYISTVAHADIINNNIVTVTFEPNNNFSNVISDLSYNVGITQIWAIFEKSIPYITVVLLFSLGVWFIRHNIIEHSKGRDF